MGTATTHYDTLSLSPTASAGEIHRAWRKAVKNCNTEEELRTVIAAGEILRHPKKREDYDNTLPKTPSPSAQQQAPGNRTAGTFWNVPLARQLRETPLYASGKTPPIEDIARKMMRVQRHRLEEQGLHDNMAERLGNSNIALLNSIWRRECEILKRPPSDSFRAMLEGLHQVLQRAAEVVCHENRVLRPDTPETALDTESSVAMSTTAGHQNERR